MEVDKCVIPVMRRHAAEAAKAAKQDALASLPTPTFSSFRWSRTAVKVSILECRLCLAFPDQVLATKALLVVVFPNYTYSINIEQANASWHAGLTDVFLGSSRPGGLSNVLNAELVAPIAPRAMYNYPSTSSSWCQRRGTNTPET